jgi:hypothetical protein
MEVEMERTNHEQVRLPARPLIFPNNQQSLAGLHACKAYQHGHEKAREHLRRAERDLAETAAFIAASLTTVTAIQAVISIAKDKLELSRDVLELAFQGYVAVFILILLLGALRIRDALRRRKHAESDIDQSKEGIFRFCPSDTQAKAGEKE